MFISIILINIIVPPTPFSSILTLSSALLNFWNFNHLKVRLFVVGLTKSGERRKSLTAQKPQQMKSRHKYQDLIRPRTFFCTIWFHWKGLMTWERNCWIWMRRHCQVATGANSLYNHYPSSHSRRSVSNCLYCKWSSSHLRVFFSLCSHSPSQYALYFKKMYTVADTTGLITTIPRSCHLW